MLEKKEKNARPYFLLIDVMKIRFIKIYFQRVKYDENFPSLDSLIK